MFKTSKFLDDYFTHHTPISNDSYDETTFHEFCIDYATRYHFDMEKMYRTMEEDTYFQEGNKTDEMVCKEVAKHSSTAAYFKLIYELIKEPLSINEQVEVVDSFNLEFGQKLLAKDSNFSQNYIFKIYDLMRYVYGLHHERTRFERASRILYVDFLNDESLEMYSDFVYAYRKRHFETCNEILHDPIIFNDVLYSNVLSFYIALSEEKYELCDSFLSKIDFRNPYIANYLRYNYLSYGPFDNFHGSFIAKYLDMKRDEQQYLEYFAFLSIFRIINYYNERIEDYAHYSFEQNYKKLGLNKIEENFIVYIMIRTQFLGSYSNKIDYRTIYKDVGKSKNKKSDKNDDKTEEQRFYTFLDTLVDKCYFDKTTRMEKNNVLEVLMLNDYSIILFRTVMANPNVADLLKNKFDTGDM